MSRSRRSQHRDDNSLADWLYSDPLVDPASIAARRMLRRALVVQRLTPRVVGRDGVVVVCLLPSQWSSLVKTAWREFVRGGTECHEASQGRTWRGGSWTIWAPCKAPAKTSLHQAGEGLAEAVANGNHCLLLVEDPSWSPSDLIPDHEVVVGNLTPTDLDHVAFQVDGNKPTERLSDEQAAELTPRLLRLARRRNQTGNAYVVALRTLLERAAVAVPSTGPTESVRDAPTLDRLHGMDEAVRWDRQLAVDLDAFRAGRLPWSEVDRGCLLSGPPSTGKTLFGRALAASCGLTLCSGSYSQWLGTGAAHQGEMLKAMRATFADARKHAPSVVFLDEIDSFPNRSTVKHRHAEWDVQVVNALLAEIDGTQSREGVILLGACNHPHKLDPAMLRSGRLDRHFRIDLPDRPALAAMLAEHLDADLAGSDLSGVALAAAGSTGADCERIVRGARRRARNAGRPMVIEDLFAEFAREEGSEADRWLAAVHEAGHAVVTCLLRPGTLDAVSTGRMIADTPPTAYPTAADIGESLAIRLAGRAAEAEFLMAPSAGAGGREDSDLAVATHLALVSVTALGLQPASGLLWRGMPERSDVGALLATSAALAAQVEEMLQDAHARALELVRENVSAIDAVACALLDRGVLDGFEVEALVREHSPPRANGAESGR